VRSTIAASPLLFSIPVVWFLDLVTGVAYQGNDLQFDIDRNGPENLSDLGTKPTLPFQLNEEGNVYEVQDYLFFDKYVL
jgi:hypothetical protein